MNKQTIKSILAVIAITLIFGACKKENNALPIEQELITTMKLTATDSLGASQTFVYKVDNGFGSTSQGTVQIDTIKLAAGKQYTVTAQLFNDKAGAADSTNAEILSERNMHLFLYESSLVTGAGSVGFSNGNLDFAGNPFNQTITLTTGANGKGQLTVSLMHAPTNKNGRTPATTGGETDAQAVFPVAISN